MATLQFIIDTAAPNAAKTFDAIAARLDKLDASLKKTREIGIGDADAVATLARVQLRADRLNERLGSMNIDMKGAASAEAQLLALEATAGKVQEKLTGAGAGTGAAAAIAAGPLSTLSYGWGVATGKVLLFGGALKAVGIPAVLSAVGAVHLLTDAVIETVAVVVPASLALGVFGVAAIPTIQAVYTKMQAVYTTSTALGQAIYPLTGGFSALAQAAQPAVYTLFGEALVVIKQNSGKLVPVIQQVGSVIDDLGARAAAALTSGGFGTFLVQGPADLAKIGDIIGNIFGTVGNLVKVMPGYAQVLLGALDDLTKGLEAVTASPVGQWILGAGLAVHGFIVWAGLGATGAVLLGNALLSLAAKFGLVAAGSTVFDAAAFGAGVKTAATGVGLLATEMVTLGAGEDIAAAGALTLEGIWAAITAVNPIVWIGAAIGALVALTLWLGKTTSATQSYDDAVNKALQNAPISQLGVDITKQMADTTGLLAQAQDKLNSTTEYYTTTIGARGGVRNVKEMTQAYSDQLAVVNGYKGELSTLTGYQGNYNTLLHAAGGNLSFLNDAGITSNDIIGASTQQMKQYIIEIQAQAAAQEALGLGIGRAAAAQNAQTNEFITSTLPAMQKVTQAEDAIVSLILSGEQAFTSFDQTLQTYGTDLGVNTTKVLGLNSSQVKLGSDLYSSVLPAFQKTIDAAQQMGVGGKSLNDIIGTEAGQILKLAGNNDTARAAMVALINNALGPGTVNFKNLNKWVGNNSTSQDSLNTIWGAATVQAAGLSGTISTLTSNLYNQDLLLHSKLTPDMNAYTTAVDTFGKNSPQAHKALQTLYGDMQTFNQKTGLAITLPPQLQSQIDKLHGKTIPVVLDSSSVSRNVPAAQKLINDMHGRTVPVVVHESGSGGLSAKSKFFTGNFALGTLAEGGLVGGRLGTYGPDDQIAAVRTGEFVMNPRATARFLPYLQALNSYASGGLVGSENWAANAGGTFGADAGVAFANAGYKAFQSQAAAQKNIFPATGLPLGGGPLSASAAVAQAFAKSILWAYGWGPGQFPPLQALWNEESGWNAYAANPTSNARGIPQSISGWSSYAPGDYQAQIRWGLAYILGRYGSPAAAYAFENSHTPHWYGYGGTFPAGRLIGVGDRGPELVSFGSGGRVFSPEQSATLAASAGSGGGTFTGQLYLDSGELLGIVRGEIRRDERETLRAAKSGSGTRR